MCRGRGGGCSVAAVLRLRCILGHDIMAVNRMENAYKNLQRGATNCPPVERYGEWIVYLS